MKAKAKRSKKYIADKSNTSSKHNSHLSFLDWRIFGIASGLFMGFYLLFSVLIYMSTYRIAGFSDEMFEMLRTIFPMLEPSLRGMLNALGIGILCGTICGSLFAMFYNKLLVLPMNLHLYDKMARLVFGILLVILGGYTTGWVSGVVFLLGCIAIAEGIFGYCYIKHYFS